MTKVATTDVVTTEIFFGSGIPGVVITGVMSTGQLEKLGADLGYGLIEVRWNDAGYCDVTFRNGQTENQPAPKFRIEKQGHGSWTLRGITRVPAS